MPLLSKLDKVQALTHFWLYFVLMPFIIGVIIGAITAKFRPYSLKLTILITSTISLVFLVVVLLTLQSQGIPQLAIMITIVSIIIMTISALISYKIISTKFTANK
jgi:hypothetical protein